MTFGAALDLPLRSYYFEEDASRSLLVNGDFEGAAGPPPAGWTASNGVVTRVAGQRTGGTGSYVMQVAYDGSHASGRGLQAGVTTVGAPYHLGAWSKGDSVATPRLAPESSPITLQYTSSGLWQFLEGNFIATGTSINAFVESMGLGNLGQYDDMFCNPLIARTKNAGLLLGSVQLGDGLTTSHFPTQIANRRGMHFVQASIQYLLRTLAADIGPNDFTFFQVIRCNSALDGAAVTNYTLMSNYNYPTSGWTWRVQNGSAGVSGSLGWVAEDGITDRTLSSAAHVIMPNAIQSVALTKVGGVLAMYVDGRQVVAPTAVINPAAYSAQINVGGQAGSSQCWQGDIFATKVWLSGFTPTQIKSLHERSMMELL